MRYSYAFFDLDGTLTDSASGIAHSVQYAVRKFGIDPPDEQSLRVFVGPPLVKSFCDRFGFSKEKALQAIEYYREYYRARGMFENAVYDGIPELLVRLRESGIVCALATCKPRMFAGQILEHFGLDRYFAVVSGPELDGTRGEKHEVIEHACRALGVKACEQVLMIGDRDNDVLGARRCGMDCAGVLWGFGSRTELESAGVRYLCNTPSEVFDVFANRVGDI